MDINIGNDIQVEFLLDTIKQDITASDIKLLECYFINPDKCDWSRGLYHKASHHSFPHCCCSTEYTIRSCDLPTYNANPVNMGHHMWDRFCGFGVNKHPFCCFDNIKAYDSDIDELWTPEINLHTVFPAKDLKVGKYRFIVRVIVNEPGWGNNDLHEYLVDFGEIINIVLSGGLSGYVEIKVNISYNIYIADNIQHGSVTASAYSAKSDEVITVTATPDPGYQLNNIVVKTADTNVSVQMTNNTFIMPKNSVIISATFKLEDKFYIGFVKDSELNTLGTINIEEEFERQPKDKGEFRVEIPGDLYSDNDDPRIVFAYTKDRRLYTSALGQVINLEPSQAIRNGDLYIYYSPITYVDQETYFKFN